MRKVCVGDRSKKGVGNGEFKIMYCSTTVIEIGTVGGKKYLKLPVIAFSFTKQISCKMNENFL